MGWRDHTTWSCYTIFIHTVSLCASLAFPTDSELCRWEMTPTKSSLSETDKSLNNSCGLPISVISSYEFYLHLLGKRYMMPERGSLLGSQFKTTRIWSVSYSSCILKVCKDLLPLGPSSLIWLCLGIHDLLTLSMYNLSHVLLTYQAIPNTFYEFCLCLMSNLLFIIYILWVSSILPFSCLL